MGIAIQNGFLNPRIWDREFIVISRSRDAAIITGSRQVMGFAAIKPTCVQYRMHRSNVYYTKPDLGGQGALVPKPPTNSGPPTKSHILFLPNARWLREYDLVCRALLIIVVVS